VFEAEKTAFIHFVRPMQPDRGSTNHLVFGNKTIAPKKSVKILGVTLDSGLSMNEHVSKAVSKAIGKCMALRKIRGVRPAQMRQMYIAAVVPTTDYAASTWYAPSRIGVKRRVVALSDVIGLDRYWMDGIRMDFGWIGSAWLALLDGLDGL
jgi:hypothetical protein